MSPTDKKYGYGTGTEQDLPVFLWIFCGPIDFGKTLETPNSSTSTNQVAAFEILFGMDISL